MTRFERTPTPVANLGIVFSLILVGLLDFYTPLGVAIWVFYFVPVVLASIVWRPLIPVAVTATVVILIVVGYFLSSPGVDPRLAILNRSFGVATSIALGVMGYQFIRNKLAMRVQEWLQAGQTRLSEAMAGDPTLGILGDKVLRTLTEYVDAQAGVLFVQRDNHFHRIATCGVTETSRIPHSIQPGDGLLGQALVEKTLRVVQDVPENYLEIGSGLGHGKPRQLLIVPIMVDGTANAILELGFFRHTDHSEPALLTRVSESIAIAVQSAQYRTRLQELLEETQRQAEELQIQSEELRVNNEELEEQTRALRESYARLEQQQAELEQTNVQLEEQAQLLEIQKGDLSSAKRSLEAQTAALEQASRYKSEFLANMSHELRTPLNASLILARLLGDNREGNLSPDQVSHAKTIESAGKDLLLLINDVLDLAKVEAGHMDVHARSVDVARLMDQLRSTFHPLAEQKKLSLQIRVSSDTPTTLVTDPQRLEQILRNLLANAIKFTEQGEVSLEISREENDRIAFAVQDSGIGIADHQQLLIFEPFCQGDGTTNRTYGGTGLGLSISRQLAYLLGGEIRLSSTVGYGSVFTVVLPIQYDPACAHIHSGKAPLILRSPTVAPNGVPVPETIGLSSTRIEDDREHLSGGRRVILIVEDDEPFARILCDLAHELDFQALTAATSAEALTLAAQYAPSAVVLDVGLPDNSGLSVLNRLKLDARTRHIPVHVVSAHDYAHTALSLGAVGYALKPVKREQLIDAFQRLSLRLAERVRRVLIVEDDAAQRESLRQLLGSSDVEIFSVSTAGACLEQLSHTTFDCMVLDLNLPDASGFSLLDTLSREDRYVFPPVIIYTGRELTADEETRLWTYSKSIIIKGAKSPERLLDEVTLFLHQVVSQLPPEQQAMLAQARPRESALLGRHLLVVEDDVRNVFALRGALEPSGADIHIARNGREALEALDQSLQPGKAPIDLVLMDVMMPEMDGLTAIREIRRRMEWKKLPIIVLTAKAMRSDQEHALSAGANDYMAKPLDVDKLLSLIRIWMPR